ncbi:COMPASS-like H3K4 histone methylase component WDR5B {ECO:0000303/PubMed:19567704} Short=AtWDR5B {ECO:0000303/PubMed:19567704}, partial [Serendipita indica DSM 11827]
MSSLVKRDQGEPRVHERVRRSNTEKWLAQAALILNLTKSAADAAGLAPLKGACEGAVTVLEVIQAFNNGRSAWNELAKTIQMQIGAFNAQLNQPGINDVVDDSVKGPIANYIATLKELLADVCEDADINETNFENKEGLLKMFVKRSGTSKLETDTISTYEKRLKAAESEILRSLTFYVSVAVTEFADAAVLGRLRGPEYKRPSGCQPGTRIDVLHACQEWVANREAPNILWIKAAPGAGKTAIASSLVDLLEIKKKRLGSSFFFRRQESTTRTTDALWRNVAYDLARHPTIRKHLCSAMKKEQIDLSTSSIADLFLQLITEPLSKISSPPLEISPVVVVDALDECGGIEGRSSVDRRSLMQTLICWSKLPSSFKLIVTSREETDIVNVLGRIDGNKPLAIELKVGKEADQGVQTDIRAVLSLKLQSIATEYPSLGPEWPGPKQLDQLTEKASGLFIWATTVVDLIEAGPPEDRLEEVLTGEGKNHLGQLYAQVLHIASRGHGEKEQDRLLAMLGAIIVAKEPLSLPTLAKLLSLKQSILENFCNGLRSVLDQEGPLRFRHQSFVDFLLENKQDAPEFSLTTSICEQSIANQCLQVMKNNLKFNIGGIPSSDQLNVESLRAITSIEDCIPSHLKYGSRYWADHLVLTPLNDETMALVRHFLTLQFLAWLEVASLCEFTDALQSILRNLTRWLKRTNEKELVALGEDIRSQDRFWILDKTVRVWNAETGEPLGPALKGHTNAVYSVAFSPDGHKIVSGSWDKTVRVWNAETGEPLGPALEGHTNAVWSVAFSPDGHKIVSGSWDKTVRVWNAETGEPLGPALEGHTDAVSSVAFSPDGHKIVSGSWDKTVRVWNAETGEPLGPALEGHTDAVWSVAFSPDGHKIVSGSWDKTVRVWNAETGEPLGPALEGHTNAVSSVAFSPDGHKIVSGSGQDETGEPLGPALEGHTDAVWSVAFSPDGHKIVSGSWDKTVRVWNAETGEPLGPALEGHTDAVWSVAFSPDGHKIVSGSWDKTVRVWNAETGEPLGPALEGHTNAVSSVAFSPDGHKIVSGSWDKTVRVWNAETGEPLGPALEGHTDAVWSVAFSPDGHKIVSGSWDKTVRVWNAETGEPLGPALEGHTDAVWSVAFSPDGHKIVSGSSDKTVRVWNAETGEPLGPALEGHTDLVYSVAFSPDGHKIVSGSSDKTVRVWNAETGQPLGPALEGHTDPVWSVAFSPDGHKIVSGSGDKTVRVWNAETGEPLGPALEGHTDAVCSVAFSPDGHKIVSGSWDKTVRVWNAETGEPLGPALEGHTNAVLSVAFSPDSHRIVSGDIDRKLQISNSAAGGSLRITYQQHRLDHDGWLVGPNDKHLIWVPEIFRTGLVRDGVVIIGQCPRVRLELSTFVYG